MNDSKISNDGINPILDVIEQYGSWNITNKNWSAADWKLERILAKTMFDLYRGIFLSVDIMSSFLNNSKLFISVSDMNAKQSLNSVMFCHNYRV